MDLFNEPFQDLEAASVYDNLRILCGLEPTAMGDVYESWDNPTGSVVAPGEG